MNKLKKEEKIRIVSELQDKFERAKGIVFTNYRGLNVEEITSLRNSLRSSAVEYRVVKNTLAKRAAEGTPVDDAKDVFSGPVGIAVGYDKERCTELGLAALFHDLGLIRKTALINYS